MALNNHGTHPKTCSFCNKPISIIDGFRCNYCKLWVCDTHRIPENHNCPDRHNVKTISEARNQYRPRTGDYTEYSGHPYSGRRKKNKGKMLAGIFAVLLIFGVGFVYFTSIDIDEIDQLKQNVEKITESIPSSEMTADIINDTTTRFLSDDAISDIPKTIRENNPINQRPFINQTELEMRIHELTNQYRVQNGLDELSWNDSLSAIARNHSLDMSTRNYFSHDTPEGLEPTDRGNKVGYDCRKDYRTYYTYGLAENIFQNNLYDVVWHTNGIPISYDWNDLNDIASSTVDGWMDSRGHRENILTETYDREGIGVTISSDDKVYITQNFC